MYSARGIRGSDLFKIRMKDARLWKNMVSAISTLIEEASFNVTSEGIKLRAMDPSHVAMVDFELPKSVFDEYLCEQPTRLNVNVGEMLKLLRRARSDESVDLSLDEAKARLNIMLRGGYTRTFSMPTLDVVGEEVPTPRVQFKASLRITTSSLRDVLDDASAVSDHVQLDINQDKFVVGASGDLGSVSVEITKESGEILGIEAEEEAKANFSLSYLSEMTKAGASISEMAKVELTTNMPVRLSFEMPQQGRLQYYLAPRIEG